MSVRQVSQLANISLDRGTTLLIFDRVLLRQNRAWIESFPSRYAVTSGERLKDLRHFPKHSQELLKRWPKKAGHGEITIAAFGGGSVGDFAGFFASVAKRGVRFVQIPSTWLAAVDSAHGGKTALNVGGAKNQIGTFHPAEKIFLVKQVLQSQPGVRLQESFGEILKAALLAGGPLWRSLKAKPISADQIWRLLPRLIAAKMKIVKQDPRETLGLRSLLNLGHSMGHVFEGQLGLPHGKAVSMGLRFAIDWSIHRGLLSETLWAELEVFEKQGFFPSTSDYVRCLQRLRAPSRLLKQDKKAAGQGKIRFIFLRRPGYPEIAKVSVEQIEMELRRQRRQLVSISRSH